MLGKFLLPIVFLIASIFWRIWSLFVTLQGPELVFKIRAGFLPVLFLKASKNVLIVNPKFFLSSPKIPCNQCPTNKNANCSFTLLKAVVISDLGNLSKVKYLVRSTPSNNTSTGFCNTNLPVTFPCYLFVQN